MFAVTSASETGSWSFPARRNLASHFIPTTSPLTLILEVLLRYFDRMQPLALLVLRLVLGIIMVAHGSHKVYGHMSEYAGYIHSLGMPVWLGYVSAVTEFAGGILLIMGFVTRCAAIAVFIDMFVAIAKVHWKHGLLGNGGYEFPLSLAAISFALIFLGGGPISIDAIRSGGGGAKSR